MATMESESPRSPKSCPSLQARSKEVFTRMETSELFDMKAGDGWPPDPQMLAVSPLARGLGLATDLSRRAILLARCLGYRGCKAEATGAYSRKLLAKVGLVEEGLVPYASFTLEVAGPAEGA